MPTTRFQTTLDAIKGGVKNFTTDKAVTNIEGWEEYLSKHDHEGVKRVVQDLGKLKKLLQAGQIDGSAIKQSRVEAGPGDRSGSGQGRECKCDPHSATRGGSFAGVSLAEIGTHEVRGVLESRPGLEMALAALAATPLTGNRVARSRLAAVHLSWDRGLDGWEPSFDHVARVGQTAPD